MGLNRKPVQRMKKLRDDVKENVPNQERVEQMDEKLNTSPGAYNLKRGIQRRQEKDFGQDSLQKKIELAWEVAADLDRFDFGVSDFGVRITLPSSAQLLARGLKAGDEVRIIAEGSALEGKKFKLVEEANSGDVAEGEIRLVSETVLRLPDDAGFSAETDKVIRVELGAGLRK